MSRRPKNSQSVALFPFLAVLVCTMGALIFLLLVTTRMIRDRATAQAVAESVDTEPDLPLLTIDPLEPPDFQTPVSPAAVRPSAEEPEPEEPELDLRALALEKRQQELQALVAQWNERLDDLNSARDERARLLAQRQQLNQAAARRVAAMQKELQELEVRLGQMTGDLTASAAGTGTVQERIELETQIRELKRRLRAAQQSQPGDHKFQLVPFDPISGTSRRPILIECTATGLKFIPEDVTVTPADLTGFTPRVNPLIVGASALVNYWTAWNIRQPKPGREPEPYVLLVVRPSGTIAYYVAMKMLGDLKQPHGYELVDEDTVLQPPPVDPGAKAACEAAVQRLLAERNQVLRQAGLGRFGTGRGGAGAGGAAEPTGSAGALGGSGAGQSSDRTAAGEFELSDILGKEPAEGHSWERIENFEGSRRGGAGQSPAAGQSPPPKSGGPRGMTVASRGNATGGTGGGPGTSAGRLAVTAGGKAVDAPPAGESPDRPGTVPARPTDGIETLDGANGAETDPQPSDDESTGTSPDIGLGSSGNRTIPVEDRRSEKRRLSDRRSPSQPEDLAHHHWGLAEPGAAIGLEREVRVDVESGRYVIGGKHSVKIADADSREDTFAKIVTVLDLQAREWGTPPKGFFWKPSLRYVIADGGDANYERVHSLLERAGLSSTREYFDDRPAETAEQPKPAFTPAPAAPTPAQKPPRRFFRGFQR